MLPLSCIQLGTKTHVHICTFTHSKRDEEMMECRTDFPSITLRNSLFLSWKDASLRACNFALLYDIFTVRDKTGFPPQLIALQWPHHATLCPTTCLRNTPSQPVKMNSSDFYFEIHDEKQIMKGIRMHDVSLNALAPNSSLYHMFLLDKLSIILITIMLKWPMHWYQFAPGTAVYSLVFFLYVLYIGVALLNTCREWWSLCPIHSHNVIVHGKGSLCASTTQ